MLDKQQLWELACRSETLANDLKEFAYIHGCGTCHTPAPEAREIERLRHHEGIPVPSEFDKLREENRLLIDILEQRTARLETLSEYASRTAAQLEALRRYVSRERP